MDWELLLQLLLIAGIMSTITCFIVQKTKKFIKSSKWIELYAFIVNIALCVPFCLTFTDINIWLSFWVGLFAFVGADELYKTLEGKIPAWKDLVPQKEEVIVIPRGDENV